MINRILAPNPGLMTGTGTCSYIVDGGRGEVAVVDPGPEDATHLQALLQAVGTRRVVAMLVTHGHVDHLPGAAALRRQTGAPLVGHPALAGVDRPLGDGEKLAVGRLELVAFATPGHTRDSLCYWLDEGRALFTGDLVAGEGTVIVDDHPNALGEYMASLERLLELGPCMIYPGHGPVVEDGQGKLRAYLDHRRQREQQVLAELRRGGGRTDTQIAEAIYTDVHPGLLDMAARNVRAHLHKLAGDGLAVQRDGTWRYTARP